MEGDKFVGRLRCPKLTRCNSEALDLTGHVLLALGAVNIDTGRLWSRCAAAGGQQQTGRALLSSKRLHAPRCKPFFCKWSHDLKITHAEYGDLRVGLGGVGGKVKFSLCVRHVQT